LKEEHSTQLPQPITSVVKRKISEDSQRQKKEGTLKKWLGNSFILSLAITRWAIFYPCYLIANTYPQSIFSTPGGIDTEQ
jgi:hypothetical protein